MLTLFRRGSRTRRLSRSIDARRIDAASDLMEIMFATVLEAPGYCVGLTCPTIDDAKRLRGLVYNLIRTHRRAQARLQSWKGPTFPPTELDNLTVALEGRRVLLSPREPGRRYPWDFRRQPHAMGGKAEVDYVPPMPHSLTDDDIGMLGDTGDPAGFADLDEIDPEEDTTPCAPFEQA